jgi:sugar phosphate isomerase/epimerase
MNMNRHPIALQLYSLRDLARVSFVDVLELTSQLGYEGVEFAGYGGLSSGEMKEHLQRLGLQAVSSHVSFERLKNHLEEEIAYNREFGNDTLVCPAPPPGFIRNAENWRDFARELTTMGKQASDQGFRLGYHNHSWEFEIFSDAYALDLLFEAADSRYVFAQLDLGWVLHGGEDPANYLRKMAGHCPLVHIKDFDQNNKQTDVGCGVLNVENVLEAALDAEVEWLILETEEYRISPEESVRAGLINLKKAQNK